MQDIVPRKTIRDIEKPKLKQEVLTHGTFVAQSVPSRVETATPITYKYEEYSHTNKQVVKNSRVWKYFVVFFVCASIGAVGYLHITKKVTVFITPHVANVSLQNEVIDVPIEEIQVLQDKKENTLPLVSTGTKNIETKAKGTVTIFNTGSQPQLLIASTRLATPANILYRLDGRITVPAAKGTVPGSIEAFVTADGTGEVYNIKIGDLTLPGLNGSPRFKQVYARISKGITGGASESTPVFEQSIVDDVIKEAAANMKKEIEQKIQMQSSSTSVSVGEITWNVDQKIEKTSVRIVVTGTQMSIDKNILATRIANEKQIRTMSEGAVFTDVQNINLQIQEQTTKNIRIRVIADARMSASIDVDGVQKQLEGQIFAQFTPIMKAVTGAKESNFTSKPFWIQSFPSANRIEVQIK